MRDRGPKPRADVGKVLDALGIKYRTHGSELWAPCPHPNHHETRPSWSIQTDPQSDSHGVHYCFGCQFTGNIVALVQVLIGGVSYNHAKQWITDRGLWLKGVVALDVAMAVTAPKTRKLKVPVGLRGGPLESWVTPARRYAVSRGITAGQVLRWRIMYGIDGDMAGRIVFPIRNALGDWQSFHARTYVGHEKRYKNASEADGFDPGAIFGAELWPPHRDVKRASTLVLCEGAINALACERAGATYVAAIGGSEAHARQLLKLSEWGRIVAVTDGDNAGDKVAESLRSQLSRSTVVERAPMEPKVDAQSMPPAALKELLDGYRVS